MQVILTYLQHTIEGAISNNCINSTSATNSCSGITYEQVYNSLAKSENSFNIESALYPAKKPSSVRVFVNVYGPNKTEDSVPVAISTLGAYPVCTLLFLPRSLKSGLSGPLWWQGALNG